MTPDFTVVMATWNRGRHILPSVRSVLQQTHRNFELLVIGDAVTDDTAQHLARIDDPRLRWINLVERWGTQSGPNNEGIHRARAPFVAFIGHDDIWAPDHLAEMQRVRETQPEADVIASGIVMYRWNVARPYRIFGLLRPGQRDEARCFIPPSGIAHRVSLARAFPWRRRDETRMAVDLDVQNRLVFAGARFATTGCITVHKFTSGARYLSYFEPSSVEQEKMLEELADPDLPRRITEIIEKAKTTDDFMAPDKRHVEGHYETVLKRQGFNRGLDGIPENMPVGDGVTLLQDDAPRAQDWRGLPKGQMFRRSGPNPNPRLLLPIVGKMPVDMRIRVRAVEAEAIEKLRLWLNGVQTPHRIAARHNRGRLSFAELELSGALRQDRASILTFEHRDGAFLSGERTHGIDVGPVTVTPVSAP